MRRVLVTVLVFILGLAVGFTVGFSVGLMKRSVDATWFEAVGTWVGAGVTAIAVILAALAFFSEEFTRRREHRRQEQADEAARDVQQAQLQKQADLVVCAVNYDSGTLGGQLGMVRAKRLDVQATNGSEYGLGASPIRCLNWVVSGPSWRNCCRRARQRVKPSTCRTLLRCMRIIGSFTRVPHLGSLLAGWAGWDGTGNRQRG